MSLVNSTLQLQVLPAGITDPSQYYVAMMPFTQGKTTSLTTGTQLSYYPATGNLVSQIITTNYLNVGTTLQPIVVNGALVPQGNNAINLGSVNSYWNTFFSNTGTFNNLYATSITANTQMKVTNSTNAFQGQANSGAFSTPGGAYIGGNLVVGGNLYVANVVTQNTSTLTVSAPLIYAVPSSPTPYNYDIGLYSDFGNPANYTGIVRSEVNGYWGFFSNLTTQPTTTANWSDTNLVWETVKAGSLTLANSTASSSTSTGALIVSGGGGFGGTVNAANFTTAGTLTAQTISVTATSGSAITPTGNAQVNVGSVSNWFSTFYGYSYRAQYADLAENYLGDKQYHPGTVLEFGGTNEVTIASADSPRVAGVVSTNPATVMNGALTGPTVNTVALIGRVPCMIIGPVAKGDIMVSAGFGYARTNNSPGPGQVLGKALEDFASAAKGVIEIVVGKG
jgi:hypothetical protein